VNNLRDSAEREGRKPLEVCAPPQGIVEKILWEILGKPIISNWKNHSYSNTSKFIEPRMA